MWSARPAAARPVGWLPVAAAGLYALSLSWSKAGTSIGFGLLLLSCLAVPGARARLAAARSHPLAVPTLAWLGVLLFGVAVSPERGEALEELRTHYPLLLVFLVPAALADARARAVVGACLLGGAFLAALAAVGQALGLYDWQPWRFHGMVGVFPYAALMVYAWSTLLWKTVTAERRALAVACYCASFAPLVGLWLNGSRIALGAVLCCALLLLACAQGRRLRLLAALLPLALLPAAVVFGPEDNTTVSRLADSEFGLGGEADSERRDLWTAGARMFREQPLLGVGMGAFRTRFDEMLAAGELSGGVSVEHNHRTAHSQPLHLLATQGVVGLAGFLYWAMAGFTLLLRRVRGEPGEVVPAFLGVTVIAVFGITDTSLQDSSLFGILALSLGYALAVPARAPAPATAPAPAAAAPPG